MQSDEFATMSRLDLFYKVKEDLTKKVRAWIDKNGRDRVDEYVEEITANVYIHGFLLTRLKKEIVEDI